MAENNTDTSQPDIDSDKFLTLLPSALPDHLHDLILDERDLIHKMFGNLPLDRRGVFFDILSGEASKFRHHLLRLESLGCPVASVPQLFNELRCFNIMAKREAIWRRFSADFDECYGNPNNGGGITGLQHQCSEPSNGTPLQLWQKMHFGSPDLAISVYWSPSVPKLSRVMFLNKEPTVLMTKSILPLEEDLHSNAAGTKYLSNQKKDVAISVAELLGGPEPSRARNPNNGAAGTLFQYQRSEPSAGTPLHHYIAALHSADVAISAAGRGTPPYHHTTGFHTNTAGTDLAISVAGSPSVPKPSHATVLDYVTNLMKEICVSLNGNPQLARDHPKWFTTLLGINGGVIITLISKSTSNNPQSLSTEIMESFTALSAVVGFSASLAGLYLITNKPQTLPVSCDSEVATPKMGIVGGIATAFAFMAGVLLLLPNNPFRWITLGLASAAFLIPVLIKLLR